MLLLLFKLDILSLAELMGAGQFLKAVRLAGLGSAFFVMPKSYTPRRSFVVPLCNAGKL